MLPPHINDLNIVIDPSRASRDAARATKVRWQARYAPAIFLFVLGTLMVIWGIVSFVLSVLEAAKTGTLSAFLKWCSSCVLVGFVGLLFVASGRYIAKAKYKNGLVAILVGFLVLVVGSAMLMPYILEGPTP